MSEWKEYKLSQCINIKHGYAFNGIGITDEDTGNRLVTPGNFHIGGGFKNSKFKYYRGAYPEDYKFKGGEIVVTMTDLSKETDALGYVAKVPFDLKYTYLHNQRVGLVQFINESVHQDFIYWLMRTYDYHWFIVGGASGTSIMHTSPTRIVDYSFNLPPLPEQQAISAVLSSLDDKIDLLHRQNKTLEAMAETLFRQWFVESADEIWEEKPLSFFGKIVCGKTPSKNVSRYFGGDIPFIKIPDMHGNVFLFQTSDTLTEEGKLSQNNKTLPPKSICVSCIATVGLVSLNVIESQTNQQINSIIPSEDYYRYFLFLIMRASSDLLHSMASGGTATPNLNTGDFSTIPITYPEKEILIQFHEEVESCFDKIFFNQSQIHTLEKLRDTLLPKLMSGEVRVAVSA